MEGEDEKAGYFTALSRHASSNTIESMSCFMPFRDADSEDGFPHDFPESPEYTQLPQGNVSPTQVQISRCSELWIPDEAQLVGPFKRGIDQDNFAYKQGQCEIIGAGSL